MIHEVATEFDNADLDALFLPETRLMENSSAAAVFRARGLQLLSVLRPPRPGSPNGNVGGGFAIIFRRERNTAVYLNASADKRGMVSITLSRAGLEPVRIIGVYMPPYSSRQRRNRDGTWDDCREELCAATVAEFRRIYSTDGPPVLLLGDFNGRILSTPSSPRSTSSPTPPDTTHQRTTNSQVSALAAACGVTPIHGRVGQLPGEPTSRTVGSANAYEIDFVMGNPALKATALPYSKWWGPQRIHRLVTVDVPLRSRETVRTEMETRGPLPPTFPFYGNEAAWIGITKEMARHIAAHLARTTHSPAPETIESLEKAIGDTAASFTPQRQTMVRAHIFRLYSGMKIPPQAADLLGRARQLRNVAKAHNREGRRDEAQDAYARAKDMQQSVHTLLRPTIMDARRSKLAMVKKLRVDDPHGFYRCLDEYSSGGDPDIYNGGGRNIPPDEEGREATETFPAYYTEALKPVTSPPALTDDTLPAGMPSVPTPDATASPDGPQPDAPITVNEMYRTIYGHNKRIAPTPCHPSCIKCQMECAAHAAWLTGEGPMPPNTSCLETSKAMGKDALPAEYLCWVRLESEAQTHAFRMELCSALSLCLNRVMETGEITPDFAETVIIPILKPALAGQAIAAAACKSYRPVSLIDLLNKVLKVCMARRVQHFADFWRLIGVEQVGFRYGVSAEQHVFTMVETIKARLREGLSTYVLFIDLRAAYDRVHQGALLRVLERMGYPPALLRLLRNMMASANAHVRVNGTTSGPIPVRRGLPQGDPLSCVLFLLFAESLSRFLKSCPELHGVTALGLLVLRHLLFADDFVAFAATREELQLVLNRINEWCKAWGMEINAAIGKSNGMGFTPDSIRMTADQAADLPPLDLDGVPVRFTAVYKYLGYLLRHDLSQEAMISKKTADSWGAFHRVMTRTPYIRASAVAEQIITLYTYLNGSLSYVLSLMDDVKAGSRTAVALNKATKAGSCAVLDRPATSSTLSAMAFARTTSVLYLAAKERERLFLTGLHSQFRGLPIQQVPLFVRLFDALLQEPQSRRTLRGPMTNWTHVTVSMRDKLIASGAPDRAPTIATPVSSLAHAFARAAQYLDWSRQLTRLAPDGYVAEIPNHDPPARGSSIHFGTLSFWMTATVEDLGSQHGHTPLSVLGPSSCSGSIVAIGVKRRYSALLAALLGTECFSCWPFNAAGGRHEPLVDGAAPPLQYGDRFVVRPCRLCDCPEETVYHLLAVCGHPTMAAHRTQLWGTICGVLLAILDDVTLILRRTHVPFPVAHDDIAATRRYLSNRGIHHDSESRFLMYWILMATPWPARVAGPTQTVARVFGALFDAVNCSHAHLRNFADKWLNAADNAIIGLAKVRRSAHAALP